MDSRGRVAFGLLIAAQAAHSVEEYVCRLVDVFAPARFVAGLFSSDIATGFALANVAIILFGFWCYFVKVRPARSGDRAYAWLWVCLELANGIGHIAVAGVRGVYFPGVVTAPLLIGISSYLGATLTRQGRLA